MTARYRVRVARDTPSSGQFQWAALDREGRMVEEGSASLDASPLRGACDVVLAAELVLLERLAVPAAQQRRIAGGLRFLAEDAALPDPERLHVAAESAPSKDGLGVAIVDRQWLQDLLRRLEAAGLEPRSAVPECLLPPLAPGSWCVVYNGAESFARTSAIEGFALDSARPGEAPVALRLALEKAAPEKIVLRAPPGVEPPDARRWSAALGVPVEAGPPWHWAQDPAAGAIEVLQREFAPRRGEGNWRARLKRPALLAGALLVIASCGIGAEWWAKAREARLLRAELQTIYRETFGDAAVIVDAPLQMQRGLAELRSRAGEAAPGDFLPLLGKVSQQLDPARQRIDSITYERGVLSVSLRPRDPAQFGALRTELQGRAPMRGVELRIETLDSKPAPALRLTASAAGQ